MEFAAILSIFSVLNFEPGLTYPTSAEPWSSVSLWNMHKMRPLHYFWKPPALKLWEGDITSEVEKGQDHGNIAPIRNLTKTFSLPHVLQFSQKGLFIAPLQLDQWRINSNPMSLIRNITVCMICISKRKFWNIGKKVTIMINHILHFKVQIRNEVSIKIILSCELIF